MAGNFKTVVPTLTEKMAKELVKKIRKEGMGVDKVIVFIQSTAPVDMREDLLNLWEEFIQEAEIFLLDELDEKMLGAMSFLKDNCNVSSD
jgi:F420-0:gamma-glutamyl ligase-like protein